MQAASELETEAKAYAHLFPGEDLLEPCGGRKILAACADPLMRCAVTRCEALLCQVLIRGTNKRSKARILQFTATCSNETKTDWKKVVHKDLVVLATAAINADDATEIL